jgi:pimeloyl-ACP methyl ester carboxylesterase
VGARCAIGNRTVAYRRMGTGPLLVVLNGFAATKDDWDPTFLAELGAEHELVLVDHRGMGESSDDGERFAIEDLADDLAGMIEELELGRPAVLGWSMGGYVAIALALAHPDTVDRLVLLSTGGGGPTATLADEIVRERLRDPSGTPRDQASRLISLLFPPERARQIDAEFGDVVAAARAALPRDVVARQWHAMEAWERGDGGQDLGRISCPVLIAAGEDDVVIPPANSLVLAQATPHSWLARFPSCGHGFMADYPEALSRLIATFLGVD